MIDDRDELVEMFRRAGIVFTLDEDDLELRVCADDNVTRFQSAPGYPGFYTAFTFSVEGQLRQVASWE